MEILVPPEPEIGFFCTCQIELKKLQVASLGGGKGQSSFYMAGNGFLVIFFEPEVPKFFPP